VESLTTLTNEYAERQKKAAETPEKEQSHIHQPLLASPSQTQQEPKESKHYSSIDELCPTCKTRLLDEAKKILEPDVSKKTAQTIREKVKSMKNPVVCKDCGEIVEKSDPACPNCSGKSARTFN
jgi:RNA polymerase subunit RPABC4/transcription elongation factor Spt4